MSTIGKPGLLIGGGVRKREVNNNASGTGKGAVGSREVREAGISLVKQGRMDIGPGEPELRRKDVGGLAGREAQGGRGDLESRGNPRTRIGDLRSRGEVALRALGGPGRPVALGEGRPVEPDGPTRMSTPGEHQGGARRENS